MNIMSTFRAKIIYTDEKELNVDMNEEELSKFSENVSNQKVYWNKTQSQGFWTDITKIRYINFIKVNEGNDEPTPNTDNVDQGEILTEVEGSGPSEATLD